jgi:hypothetical protein
MSAKPRAVLTAAPGERFGRLVVRIETVRPRGPAAVCRCDCGNSHTALIFHLRAGTVQSCGCLRSEVARGAAAKRWARKRAAAT